MRGSAWAAALPVLALGGCLVGPDYKAPTPPAGGEAPLVSLNRSAETNDLPPDEWWRLYADPRLDGYIREAIAANYDLAAAEANLAASRATLEAARTGLYPSTSVELGAIYGRDPTTDEILELGGRRPKSGWIFDDLLDVSYELDLFGHVHRSIEAVRDDSEAVQAARDDLKVTLVAETARAYGDLCTLGEQMAVAEHSLTIVGHEADIAAQRHGVGGNAEFDVVRVQQEVAQVRSEIPPLQGKRRAALFELAALLGRPPSRAPNEALSCVVPPHLVSLLPVGDGSALLKRRPDIREAERSLAGSTARIGVATAELYPRINLLGTYGAVAGNLSNLTAESGLAWGVGPSINWEFPNQAAPRARIRAAEAGAAQALSKFDSAVVWALKETESALATYGAELDRRAALADAQAKAHRAFDLARGQLSAGSISALDLLTTEQTMVGADSAVAASDTALVQDQIAVFKALGGGWQIVPPVNRDRPAS
ncbi:MAG TPA: TolC family protein [Aliidongia sp.]|nr:TolC family protein [Aliidongia sp.]